MERRPLPGTDLEVSVVGMGCWAIGGRWWGDDVKDADSEAAVRAALEAGITWFDTAPIYGYGHADRVLCRALGDKRHDVLVATKVGPRWAKEGDHPVCDLSPESLEADVAASLSRLGLDTLPLVQIHWPCEVGTPLEQTFDALAELAARGRIRHVGLSNYDAGGLAAAKRAAEGRVPLVVLQTPYSMIRRELEGRLLDVALEAPSMGVLAYEPLCRGLLSGKFGPEPPPFPDSDMRARDVRFAPPIYGRIYRLVQGLARIGEHFEATAAQLALAWVVRARGITSAIAGAKRPAQVQENAAAAALASRDDVPWEVIDQMASAVRI
jgi:methylglyoxal reductase